MERANACITRPCYGKGWDKPYGKEKRGEKQERWGQEVLVAQQRERQGEQRENVGEKERPREEIQREESFLQQQLQQEDVLKYQRR